jgi:hypothetical protein
MHEAVKAFRNAPSDASKTFIFTGNMLNVRLLPGMINFGLGKAVPAYAIRHLVEFGSYTSEGIKWVAFRCFVALPWVMSETWDWNADGDLRFYYADERTSNGDAVNNKISGVAAAEAYPELAERKEQGPWFYTFVRGEGYKDFEGAKL